MLRQILEDDFDPLKEENEDEKNSLFVPDEADEFTRTMKREVLGPGSSNQLIFKNLFKQNS